MNALRLLGWIAAGLAAALSASAAADVTVGQPAPAFSAADWLNTPPLSLAKLRGKVAVVEFWATWCPPCRQTIPHLVELHKTYAPKGVVIVSLTNEDKAKVEPFAREMNMTYPVGCGSPSGEAYGVRGIPHAFVIDVEGKVVWHGHPAGPELEKTIQEQLKTHPPTLLAPEERAKALALVEKAEKALAEKQYAAAAAALAGAPEAGKDPAVDARAAPLREQLTTRAEARLAEAAERTEAKAWFDAYEALREVAALAPGSDLAQKASAQLAEMKKNEAATAAIAQGLREQTAAAALAKVEKGAADMDPAARLAAYDALAKDHAGTEAGASAAAKAKAMRADTALMARLANEAAERDCKGWLSMARNFAKAGLPDKARPYLQKVIDTYPDTDFAAEAKAMLANLANK
jgi:thiol-disulfide isomerase/thioredoxin